MLDTKVMEAVQETGSSNEKIALLKRLPRAAIEYFRRALDPTITFGVTCDVAKLVDRWKQPKSLFPAQARADWWSNFYQLLDDLASRRLTGNSALFAMETCLLDAPEVSCVIWGARAINKDLRCGVQASTVNKVWPKLIDDLTVMLARPYDPAKHQLMGRWAISPKLDGYRMTIIDGIPYSRNKRIYTTVDHILEAIGPKLLAEHVWDGEIMGPADDFDEAGGKIRRKGEQASGAVYHVFDLIPRDQWLSNTIPFEARNAKLHKIVTDLHWPRCVKPVDHVVVTDPTPEKLFETMRIQIEKGFEGAMVRSMDDPYIYDRTDLLLKLKDFVSADVPIVGWQEGRGKHKGKLGAWMVELDGVQSKVGSGFTDAQREEYWRAKEELKGKLVEVQYQNLTKDGAMRFPVFLRFRPDKE